MGHPVSVSRGCCNTGPQTEWPEAHIYSLTVLEARGLQLVSLGSSQGVGGAVPSGGPGGQSVPSLLELPESAGIPWLVVL